MNINTTSLIRLAILPAAAVACLSFTASAEAEVIYGLTTQNSIAIIDSDAPVNSVSGGRVRGIAAGEILQAIDYRPASGDIYAVGDFSNLYTIDPMSFNATLVGSGFSEDIVGTSYAFDFNPAFMSGEFARLITDTDDNRVVSGDTGDYLLPVEKTDVFYPAGDPNQGVNPNIAGIAYTNSVAGATSTQQFGIDRGLGVLVTVANNAGTLNTVGSLGVSPLTNELGLDISGQTGTAFAALQTGPNSELYTINLSTGAATSLGVFGSGDLIRDLTVVPIPEPASLGLFALGGLALRRRR